MLHPEYRQIRKLFFLGYSYKEISDKLGLCFYRIRSLGASKKLKKKKERYHKFLVHCAFLQKINLIEMSERTGISVLILRETKRKLGLATKRFNVHNKRITDEMKSKMIEMYKEGFTSGQIAKYFNYKTRNTVLQILWKNGIKTRDARHTKKNDYTYFEKIDSHDKAYILGLLYTDGYIQKDYCGIGCQLTEEDGYLLNNIANRIGESATVIKINCDYKRKSMPNAKDMIRLGIYSKELALQVKELGVIKHKTYDMEIPLSKVPKKYYYSLFRGIIDGDGTLGIYNNYPCCKMVTKSERFAKSICKLLSVDKIIKVSCKKQKSTLYHVIVGGGRKSVISFLKKMYKNKSDLFLTRKYDKIKHLIEDNNENLQNSINEVNRNTENLQFNNEIRTA